MLDCILPYLGEALLGVCAAICTVAYWLDARRRGGVRRRRLFRAVWPYAKMRPLSRSTTERRD